jgi:hypothetical protein
LAVGDLVINVICFGTSSILDNRAWPILIGGFYIASNHHCVHLVRSRITSLVSSTKRVENARKSLVATRQGVFTNNYEVNAEFQELQVSCK